MLSEPVEKMASSVATPEAGTPQDIPTLDTCPHRTMRVRKRTGSTEPVDVTKIVRAVDRTAREVPMRSLIDMAADCRAFIDQSQSLSLLTENPNIEHLSNMYFYVWKRGLRRPTTYVPGQRDESPRRRVIRHRRDRRTTAHAPSLIPGGCRLHHREERGGALGWVISKMSGTHERPLVVSPRDYAEGAVVSV